MVLAHFRFPYTATRELRGRRMARRLVAGRRAVCAMLAVLVRHVVHARQTAGNVGQPAPASAVIVVALFIKRAREQTPA